MAATLAEIAAATDRKIRPWAIRKGDKVSVNHGEGDTTTGILWEWGEFAGERALVIEVESGGASLPGTLIIPWHQVWDIFKRKEQ